MNELMIYLTRVDLGDNKGPAVKSVELHVAEQFGRSFYDACKDVKFAATNGLAMEFSKAM